MTAKSQTLILIILILIAVGVTNISLAPSQSAENKNNAIALENSSPTTSLNFERSILSGVERTTFAASQVNIKILPSRNWDILDPKINSQSILVQSLDEYFPFYHLNTQKMWPMASLTKLLTAVVALEDIGENKKILITEKALATEGIAGNLIKDDIYSVRDLLKIMFLTSSNDAASAFEEYIGGKNEFAKLLNQKTRKIGMMQTVLYDASGLSDLNQSNTGDLLKLVKYILQNHPDIFNWTRLNSFLAQPLNGTDGNLVQNINPLFIRDNFLGGKTGTSDEAKENLVAIFSFKNYRIATIILGSSDRIKEIDNLFEWMEEAYSF